MNDEWAQSYVCPDGCTWQSRCVRHAAMMTLIREAWEGKYGDMAFYKVCEVSSYPEMAGDWSGVRDSTPEAVERMWYIARIYRAAAAARKQVAAWNGLSKQVDAL